jgi:hypothetical protein
MQIMMSKYDNMNYKLHMHLLLIKLCLYTIPNFFTQMTKSNGLKWTWLYVDPLHCIEVYEYNPCVWI